MDLCRNQTIMEPMAQYLPIWKAMVYCFLLSVSFVCSFYLFVPKRIQQLDRNHPIHIQWRAIASTVYVVLAGISLLALTGSDKIQLNLLILSNVFGLSRVVFHTSLIYFGPILEQLIDILGQQQQSLTTSHTKNDNAKEQFLINTVRTKNDDDNEQFWKAMRNFVIAPIIEEIVFRCYLFSVLNLTKLTTSQICWIGPLFFGVAHFHHALTLISKIDCWHKKDEIIPLLKMIMFQTLFQMIYTTLFGSYVMYAYIRTSYSILAVICCHSFCNYMGLPTFRAFYVTSKSSPSSHTLILLYRYRYLIQVSYVVGVVAFALGHSTLL